MSDAPGAETVVLNERRESEPPLAPRRTRSWQAPAVIALFLVIAGGAAAVGIALGAQTTVDTAAPAVGACRTYDTKAALAPTNVSPVVDCSAQHSAQTFNVTSPLPDPSSDGTWSERQIAGASAMPCGEQTAIKALGTTTERWSTSRFTIAFFMPDAAQAKAGARWIRCDVVLADRGDLVTVAGDFTDLIKTPGAFTACVDPDDDRQVARSCTGDPTLLAAIATIPLGKTVNPTTPSVVGDACRKIAVAEAKVASPTYKVTFPSVAAFAAGRDFAECRLQVDQWKVSSSDWPSETSLGNSAVQDDVRSV